MQRFMSYRANRDKNTRIKTIQSIATARTVTIKTDSNSSETEIITQ